MKDGRSYGFVDVVVETMGVKKIAHEGIGHVRSGATLAIYDMYQDNVHRSNAVRKRCWH